MHYHGDREIHDDPNPIYLWTRRLAMSIADADQDLCQIIADEIGDCLECWQEVACALAERWVSALNGRKGYTEPDYAAKMIAATLVKPGK